MLASPGNVGFTAIVKRDYKDYFEDFERDTRWTVGILGPDDAAYEKTCSRLFNPTSKLQGRTTTVQRKGSLRKLKTNREIMDALGSGPVLL